MFEILLLRFRALSRLLFEPAAAVTDADARRHARLISALLLVVTLGTLSGALYTPEKLELVRSLLQGILLPLFLLYLLSRTSRYLIAAVLTIPLLMLTPYVSLAYLPLYNQSLIAETIMWLLLPMSIAVITLPLRLSFIYLLLNVVVLGSMPGWLSGFDAIYLGNGLSFIVITTALLLVIAAIRNRDLADLQARAEDLQQQKQWLELEINERQLVETEVGNLQSVINGVNEAVLLVTPEGVIKRANQTSLKMFGYQPHAILGHNITVFIDEFKDDSQEPLISCLLSDNADTGKRWYPFRARDAEGNIFPAEAYAASVILNGMNSLVLTVRDMTEHKRIESLKDEFVSSVSHELRTPLTSIQGAIGLVHGVYAGELSDKVKSLVNIVYDNSSSLCSLVDDILDISKLESEQMPLNYELLNMTALMQELLKNSTPLASKFSVQFTVTPGLADVSIVTDKKRMAQVLRNLLSNAAKFSLAGGQVEMGYVVDNGKLRISVTDHGIGIPANLQLRVFDKFFQVQTTSKQARSGTGLGLSITRRIVEQMDGKIWVESEPGNTCFYVELPMTSPSVH